MPNPPTWSLKMGLLSALLWVNLGPGMGTSAIADPPDELLPCPRLVFTEPLEPHLSDDERKLLCGDSSIPEWSKLPLPQLDYHLRSVLASRGYHAPRIRHPDERTVVTPGALARVTGVQVTGAETLVGFHAEREFVGRPLNRALLSAVADELTRKLREVSYLCPKVDLEADPLTGVVSAKVDLGTKDDFSNVIQEDAPGIAPGVMARYLPFERTDPFVLSLLHIGENRVSDSELVFSNHFTINCEKRAAPEVRQHFVSGPPRLLSLAVGANTELGPIAKLDWKHTRFWGTGSSALLSARASFREQRFSAAGEFFTGKTPLHLAPTFSLGRTDAERLSYFSVEDQLGARTWADFWHSKLTWFGGVGTQHFQRLAGVALEQTFTGSLDIEAEVMSHSLELSRGNPESGMLVSLKTKQSAKGMLADQSASLIDLGVASYWNLREDNPPKVILTVRTRGVTTFTDAAHSSPLAMPVNYRRYLGGSASVRGFGLNEMPLDEAGALSLGFFSIEARTALPWIEKVYVLGFWDGGFLGTRGSAHFDETLYHSPGFGLYWVSPIGVIKATLAHGSVARSPVPVPTHWQFFIALGEGL